jgi:6-pyruvoyltetrahydropterin/6-carboxytetrahydropterin synthase
MHGHNYRFHFTVVAKELDKIGRVIDFSVIKSHLAMWLEENWDHKFLLWENDPLWLKFKGAEENGCIPVKFNPTAENMAKYFVETLAPTLLLGTGATLVKLKIEETRKCSAIYEKY